jgi:hypothetical protein
MPFLCLPTFALQKKIGHWIMLELYDQTVRNFSGGEMFQYFVRESIPNENFVLERCGVEAKKLIESGRKRFIQNGGGGGG